MPVPPSEGPGAIAPIGVPPLAPLPPLPLARAALNRSADRRTDEAWFAAQWANPDNRRYVVSRATVLVDTATAPALRSMSPQEAPPGDRYLLGVDESGVVHAAVCTAEPVPGSTSLRRVAPALSDRDGSLAVHAVGLANWHAHHTRCARCGAPTVIAEAGHVRRCPQDGSDHFPRTDPAVITLVVDPRGRALLAHGVGWSPGQYALLAGFVEPGESAEQAIVREVYEEVGVRVHRAVYLGSQPHPYPSSLMLGFMAHCRESDLRPDHTEVEDARWVSRDDLTDAIRSGEIAFAPSVSIARRMIESWYGACLP